MKGERHLKPTAKSKSPTVASLRKRYDNLDFSFSLEGYTICALNIVFEQFKRPIPAHSHTQGSYEIHFIPYGKGEVYLDGTCFPLQAGSLYVTGPGVMHEQFADSEDPMAEYCIYFHITQREKRANTIVSRFLAQKLWIGTDSQHMESLLQTLFGELSAHKTGFAIEVRSLLQQCIVRMVRNYENAGCTSAVSGNQNPQKAASCQNADIFQDLSVSSLNTSAGSITAIPSPLDLRTRQSLLLEECFLYDYASLTLPILSEKLGLSIRQTQRLLREQYGQNFQQKKTAARMSAAAALLHSSKESIALIGEQLGFSSAEHFSAAFHRYYAMTPSAYRHDHRKTSHHSTPIASTSASSISSAS